MPPKDSNLNQALSKANRKIQNKFEGKESWLDKLGTEQHVGTVSEENVRLPVLSSNSDPHSVNANLTMNAAAAESGPGSPH